MYGLSANSQNMQGKEIDSLCLEEPFRNALSEVCHLEASYISQGSQNQLPKSLGRKPVGFLGDFSQV